jgi:hypothetical protein
LLAVVGALALDAVELDAVALAAVAVAGAAGGADVVRGASVR